MPIFGNQFGYVDPQTSAVAGNPVIGNLTNHAAIGAGGVPSIHAGGLGSLGASTIVVPAGDVMAPSPLMSFVGGVVVGSLITFVTMKMMKKGKKK